MPGHESVVSQNLRRSIPKSSDLELRFALQSLLVRVGDGHTTVVSDFFLQRHGAPDAKVQFLPTGVFLFDDGVRIVSATAPLKPLLGARVLAIGQLKMDSAIKSVGPYVSRDNEWGALTGKAMALTDVSQLTFLGAGSPEEGFDFTVELLSGEIQHVVLKPGGPEALDRVSLMDVPVATPSPSFKERHKPLYIETVGSCEYARIDVIGDTHEESLADFTRRLFTTAETTNAQRLILDLRNCPGGEGHLTAPLLHGLIASERFNKPGALCVLVGRTTFSAAMALAAELDVHTEALFVGEPTGSRPNFVGETSVIRLPYSGLHISISSRYHQNGGSNDKRLWIPPDISSPPNFDDWRAGRDEALATLLKN